MTSPVRLTASVGFPQPAEVQVHLTRNALSDDPRWEEGLLLAAALSRHGLNLGSSGLTSEFGIWFSLLRMGAIGRVVRNGTTLPTLNDLMVEEDDPGIRCVLVSAAPRGGRRIRIEVADNGDYAPTIVKFRGFGFLGRGQIEHSQRALGALVWALLALRPGDSFFRRYVAEVLDAVGEVYPNYYGGTIDGRKLALTAWERAVRRSQDS